MCMLSQLRVTMLKQESENATQRMKENFTNHTRISDKEFLSKIYKEDFQLNNKKVK